MLEKVGSNRQANTDASKYVFNVKRLYLASRKRVLKLHREMIMQLTIILDLEKKYPIKSDEHRTNLAGVMRESISKSLKMIQRNLQINIK